MTICQVPGCQEHYGCRLRDKGLQVSPRVNSTATRNWRPTPSIPPAHYKNVLTEDRPGGFKSPILHGDGTVIRHREAQREHHDIKDRLARTRAAAANTKAR